MATGKKIFLIAAVLLVIIAGALVYIWTNLDWIVKEAIEKYGSKVTKTAVRVSSVKLKLSSGKGSISGLTISNPSGFSSAKAFSLGKISVKLNTDSVTSKIVVIDRIIISAPQIIYEVDASGASNIDALKKNIRQSTKETVKKSSGKKKNNSRDVKYVIRKLIIENGIIDLRIASLGNKSNTLTLPRIERTNIGGSRGITPSEAAAEIASALVTEAGIAVARSGVEGYFGKGVVDAVKGLFGK